MVPLATRAPHVSTPSSSSPATMTVQHEHADPAETDNVELSHFLDRTRTDRVTFDISSRLPFLGNPHDIALVARMVQDDSEDDAARNEGINLLGRSEYDHLTELLFHVLDSEAERPRFRAFATQRLGMLMQRDEDSFVLDIAVRLRSALNDRHLEVRREALLALAHIQDSQASSIIQNGLGDPEWADARDLIIRCLYEEGAKGEIPAIRRFLSSGRESERIAALYVLGRWNDGASEEAIRLSSVDPANVRIRRAGLQALRALHPPQENPSDADALRSH
jgi:HEAT repeat protein